MTNPASVNETKLPTGARLWWPKALILSAINWPIDFYPRLTKDGKFRTRPTETLIAEHVEATKGWDQLASLDAADLDGAIALARASLDEAKSQTEYQDQKATRLLTVTTFLSALSAGLYAAFTTAHPIAGIRGDGAWAFRWQLAAHLTFVAFVVAAIGGMLITFHATRTRFKYPPHATAKKEGGPTRSYLFFREMIGVTPAGWADSFVTRGSPDQPAAALKADLKVEYLKNYVGEAYLVAAKTADKLRYLEPAQSLLAWALRALLLFVVLIAIINANWPSVSSKPTRVEGGGEAVPVRIVR